MYGGSNSFVVYKCVRYGVCIFALWSYVMGSYIRKWSMHVVCFGWCAGLKVGSCGPSNSVKGSVRSWQDLFEELVQSP